MGDELILWFKTYAVEVVLALLFLFIGRIVAKKLAKLIKHFMDKAGVDATLSSFLKEIIYYLLFAAVIIAALEMVGIKTTSIIAILAAAGLAIGLALKDSLSNIASGVMIIFFRPFVLGDFITAGGVSGSVKQIGIFSTFLTSPDNKLLVVPNSSIMGDSITNFSANPTRRIDLVFGIGYDDDLLKAKNLIIEILEKHEQVLADPKPVVAVLELADSSVNFAVRPWVNKSDYWDVYFDLVEKIKLEFDANGISIPYPQTDVHIKKG